MKKTFWSLAALMLMAAPVMTSCNNDLDEVAPVEETQKNVVTITLNVEQQPETRVGVGSDFKLTSWEVGDVVMLYNNNSTGDFAGSLDGEGVEFECKNASSGTFSGTLPTGKSLTDYNLAVYGGTAEVVVKGANKFLALRPKNYVSTDIADLVVMAGTFDGTSATLKIVNNIIKLNNTSGAEVVATWKNPDYGWRDYITWVKLASIEGNTVNLGGDFATYPHYTIPTGECYLYMPSGYDTALSLTTEGGINVLPARGRTKGTAGKLYDGGTFTGTSRD